ncbi:hypothetical protein Tco_0307949, partial [Tanacetum coccineum]
NCRWQNMAVRGGSTRYEVLFQVAAGQSECDTWHLACVRYEVSVYGSMPIIGNNVAVGGEQKDQNTLRSSNMSGG